MRQVILRQGSAFIEETGDPSVEPGSVIVRVSLSCISTGTELAGLATAGQPLWRRALAQPDNVRKVVQSVQANGLSRTVSMVQGKLAGGAPSGYSVVGVVEHVGEGIDDLFIGDRVACAGAQFANHAELVRVPRNLVVPVPQDVSDESAAMVTLGAIALQGVRRANPTLGEVFVVVGLGALGLLTMQMLRANGCVVIGADLDESRIALAKSLGMEHALATSELERDAQVSRLTNGVGADGVIITAAGKSDQIVSEAFRMCRRKGRVVLVGDVGLSLQRSDIYAKELDFLVSCSYGPGRYDKRYEEDGLDYPVAYVRWTENRNMSEYIRLVATKSIRTDGLVRGVYELENAAKAYADLRDSANAAPLALLRYPVREVRQEVRTIRSSAGSWTPNSGRVGIGLVGVGAFAKGTHLPNLVRLRAECSLEHVVSRTGHAAAAVARQFEFGSHGTDVDALLQDPRVQAVVIATRHDSHADLVVRALAAGKHVFVEKPLCLNADELALIASAVGDSVRGGPILMTGFNRRFSPHLLRIAKESRERVGPLMISYRMNAGYLPPDHWTHGKEGGGRNIGEACHIYDLFGFLTNATVESVDCVAVRPSTAHYSHRDNFSMQCQFSDGSVANLIYTAMGNRTYPKENLEMFWDGKVANMADFKSTDIVGVRGGKLQTRASEKGQFETLSAFIAAIRSGAESPIPFDQQRQAMQIAFEVDSFLGSV